MTVGERRFVFLWTAGLLVLYAHAGYSRVHSLREYAAESARTRAARTVSPSAQPGAQAPALPAPAAAGPVDVLVGGRLNHAGEVSAKESAWTADFNLWFSWSDAAVNPGEAFRVVNGQILEQTVRESYHRGNEHYSEYRVVARMTTPFDADRFPFAEQDLFIQLEDASPPGALRYVPDKRNSEISPEAMPRSVKATSFRVDVRTSSHRSSRLKPGPAGEEVVGRSQFMLEMLVVPDGMGTYRRLFQALFASAAVALIALYIKPTHVDCRFGLPVGGFFASVSNNIFVGSLLPNADRPTLTDMVNAVSLFTIFLILVQSVISLYIYDTMGRERLSRIFDRASLAVFLLGYVAVNLALPLAARPS